MNSLRLDRIRLTHVRVPLVEPFAISHAAIGEKDAILVEVFAEGLVGLGEASPMAGTFYSAQTPESSWSVLTENLVPLMQRAQELDLAGRWLAGATDDSFACCGVDGSLWDLVARARNRPLWSLLGGNGQREIPSGLAVGIHGTIEELLDRIERFVAAHGYRRVKIKVKPGWDVEPLKAVRRRFGNVSLMVDANCAYGRQDIEPIVSWDRFGLMMIEQPLAREDLEGHALLAARCHTPICLDESAETVEAVERAVALNAAQVVNIKLQRVGTLWAARRIHDMTAEAGIGCWMGTMPELGVGACAAMHFATLPNIVYPTDVEASERWFVAEVTTPPVRCVDGLLVLPPGPGLGVSLNAEVVRRYRVREEIIQVSCRLRPVLPPGIGSE